MQLSRYAERLINHETAAAWAVHAEARRRWRAGEDLMVLSIGDHDFTTDGEIVEAAVSSLRRGRHHYTPSTGFIGLREKIAAYHTATHGEAVTVANIAVVPGAQCGLFAAGLATLDRGDEVIAFDPMYVTYYGALTPRGAIVKEVPLRPEAGFLPDLDELAAAIGPKTRAIVLNSPHNPTGRVWPRATIEGIAAVAREHDLWVLSDEVYGTMCFDAPHVSPRSLPGMADRTAAIHSLSKSHAMTGWRIGWVVAPEQLIEGIDEVMGAMMFGSPPFIQDAAEVAVSSAARVAGEIRETYRRRRDAIVEALAGVPKIRLHRPEAGMFLVLDIRETGIEALAFARRLLDEQGISLLPGEGFSKRLAGHLRLSYCVDEDRLREAARRISAFVQRHAV
jgi:arginine:pyruvate transaminase